MNELKAHRFITTDELFPEANAGALYYDKSEADKVIADLKQKMKQQDVLLGKALNTISESHKHVVSLARKCNHSNYKRCLAMAEACKHKRWRTDEGFDYARSHRHMNKWLAIAEKFKTNSTINRKEATNAL